MAEHQIESNAVAVTQPHPHARSPTQPHHSHCPRWAVIVQLANHIRPSTALLLLLMAVVFSDWFSVSLSPSTGDKFTWFKVAPATAFDVNANANANANATVDMSSEWRRRRLSAFCCCCCCSSCSADKALGASLLTWMQSHLTRLIRYFHIKYLQSLHETTRLLRLRLSAYQINH